MPRGVPGDENCFSKPRTSVLVKRTHRAGRVGGRRRATAPAAHHSGEGRGAGGERSVRAISESGRRVAGEGERAPRDGGTHGSAKSAIR